MVEVRADLWAPVRLLDPVGDPVVPVVAVVRDGPAAVVPVRLGGRHRAGSGNAGGGSRLLQVIPRGPGHVYWLFAVGGDRAR